MSTEGALRYSTLRDELLQGRAKGTLSAAAEDALLDEMDSVWWSLTEAERQESDRSLPEAEARVAAVVPSSGLSLIDAAIAKAHEAQPYWARLLVAMSKVRSAGAPANAVPPEWHVGVSHRIPKEMVR